jgi:hypothetical protein
MYYTISDLIIPASSVVTYQRRCVALDTKSIMKSWKKVIERKGYPFTLPEGVTISEYVNTMTTNFSQLLEQITNIPICRIKLVDGTHLDTILTKNAIDKCLSGFPVQVEDFTKHMNNTYGGEIKEASGGVFNDFYELVTTTFANPLV